MEREIANVESTARKPFQFGVGQVLLATCVLGVVGGLVVRSFDVIAEAVLSSSVASAGLFFGLVVAGAVMSLFVVIRLAYEEYRPISAILYLLVGGITLHGWFIGNLSEEGASWVACFLVFNALIAWVEVIVCEVWHEHWSTALALTIGTGCWGILRVILVILRLTLDHYSSPFCDSMAMSLATGHAILLWGLRGLALASV